MFELIFFIFSSFLDEVTLTYFITILLFAYWIYQSSHGTSPGKKLKDFDEQSVSV